MNDETQIDEFVALFRRILEEAEAVAETDGSKLVVIDWDEVAARFEQEYPSDWAAGAQA